MEHYILKDIQYICHLDPNFPAYTRVGALYFEGHTTSFSTYNKVGTLALYSRGHTLYIYIYIKIKNIYIVYIDIIVVIMKMHGREYFLVLQCLFFF